ncbi:MAG: hypothetical protein K0Q71_2178 [Thermomicrobiales bacterium]|nr:hypothetical protein [Thermomicrobiales bacterium]
MILAGSIADGERSADPETPAVSVIVATYNRCDVLGLALQSLLAQTLGDFEALVVGDACTDNSEAVVRGFGDPRLHWHNLPSNSGSQAGPNNYALQVARGRYVAFLGHDDLWFPWHLEGLVGFIEETGADFVHSLAAMIDRRGVRSGIGPPEKGVPYAENHFPPSIWLHRRELVNAVGLWQDPTTLPWPIDFDFMRQAALGGARIDFHPRLSVLKFPSPWFGPVYANIPTDREPPQTRYARRMQRSPQRLEHDLLLQLAIVGARAVNGRGTLYFQRPAKLRSDVALMKLPWSLRRRLLDRGILRLWPVREWLTWRYQRRRNAMRVKRGLLPAGVADLTVDSPEAAKVGGAAEETDYYRGSAPVIADRHSRFRAQRQQREEPFL